MNRDKCLLESYLEFTKLESLSEKMVQTLKDIGRPRQKLLTVPLPPSSSTTTSTASSRKSRASTCSRRRNPKYPRTSQNPKTKSKY